MTTTYLLGPEQTDLIRTAVDLAGLYDDSDTIRTDYSGRGMYGDRCFGIVVADQREAARVLVNLATLDGDLAVELADRWTTDSMGMTTIVYFPGVAIDADLIPEGDL